MGDKVGWKYACEELTRVESGSVATLSRVVWTQKVRQLAKWSRSSDPSFAPSHLQDWKKNWRKKASFLLWLDVSQSVVQDLVIKWRLHWFHLTRMFCYYLICLFCIPIFFFNLALCWHKWRSKLQIPFSFTRKQGLLGPFWYTTNYKCWVCCMCCPELHWWCCDNVKGLW